MLYATRSGALNHYPFRLKTDPSDVSIVRCVPAVSADIHRTGCFIPCDVVIGVPAGIDSGVRTDVEAGAVHRCDLCRGRGTAAEISGIPVRSRTAEHGGVRASV